METNVKVKGIWNKLRKSGKKQLNVFVVDDDPNYLKLINHQLKTVMGNMVNVHTFQSGDACMMNLHYNPDVVIMDQYLDEDNVSNTGLNVMKQLKRISPDLYVLIISGKNDVELSIKAIKEGALDFIHKGKNAIQRILNDFSKVLNRMIKAKEESQYQNYVLAVKIIVGTIVLSVACARLLVPSIFQ